LQLDVQRGQLAAGVRVPGGVGVPDRAPQPVQFGGEARGEHDAEGPALVGQRGHRDPPPVVHPPEHGFRAGPRAGEDDLPEAAVAGHPPDRPRLHAGGAHVDQQAGEPGVVGGGRARPGEQQALVGEVGAGGPDLLAVDAVAVAVEGRPGAYRGQVGTGAGLGEALAEDHVTGEDQRQVAGLLGRGAVPDDARADHVEPDRVGVLGCAGRRALLGVDRLVGGAEPTAAVFGGPGDPGVSGGVQGLAPGPQLLGFELLGVAGDVRAEPAPQPGAKLPLMVGVG
jgi:hypothetical protein